MCVCVCVLPLDFRDYKSLLFTPGCERSNNLQRLSRGNVLLRRYSSFNIVLTHLELLKNTEKLEKQIKICTTILYDKKQRYIF